MKKHYLAILLALLVGAIYIAPHTYFAYKESANYQGIYMSRASDEEGYFTVINRIYENGEVGNPYIFEYKDKGVSEYYRILELALAQFGKVFRLTISQLALVMKFFLPAILFVVVYLFMLALSGRKGTALLGGILVLLGNEMARLSVSSIALTFLGKGLFNEFLQYSRPVNPEASAIFFFLALWLLLKLYQERNSKVLPIVAGIFVGALAYIYFYFWAFALVLCGIILIYAAITRNKALLKDFFFNIVAGIVAVLPFLIKVITLYSGASGKTDQSQIAKAFIHTHNFIFEKVILLPFLIFLFFYLWQFLKPEINQKIKAFNEHYRFLFFLLVTCVIVSNQQVITGIEIQQHHFHFFTNIPMFLIASSVFSSALIYTYFFRFSKIIFALLVFFVLLHAVGVQTSSYRYWAPQFSYYQRYAPIFSWLNEHSKKDDVVYSDHVISEMIPMYTSDYVYSAEHAAAYPVPIARLTHNYFVDLYLRGVDSKSASEYFYKEDTRNEIGQYVFEGQYFRDLCGSSGCFPDSVLDQKIKDYKVFLGNSFETNLKQYKIDYAIWDKNKDSGWNLDRFKFLKMFYENAGVTIYKVL